MKQFEIPEIEILRFAIQDVITSSDGPEFREDEFPIA